MEKQPIDAPLDMIGFEIDELSPHRVSGHFLVTSKCCQLFGFLHGGVSALIAETLASLGAVLASGMRRVAGINLNINHLKSAQLGDLVVAEAKPINLGKIIQVWDVRFSKCEPSKPENKTLIASSRVAIYCNLPEPEFAKVTAQNLKKQAKL